MLPALFVSHGAPNVILHDSPTRRFFNGLGVTLGRPRAIVAISAHWPARAPRVNASPQPETIYDFYGFEPAMYEMTYPAPGAPELAEEIAGLLGGAGLQPVLDHRRGLDHGVWSPLKLMYPDADIPVTQISVQPLESTQHHFRMGEALRALRERDILIFASGNATHNLGAMMPEGSAPPDWVSAFAVWLRQSVAAADAEALLDYRSAAPYAVRNHPTAEHFLPLFCALGAGTPGRPGRPLHSGNTFGVLEMDAFAFD